MSVNQQLDPHLKRLFYGIIAEHCNFAMIATNGFNQALSFRSEANSSVGSTDWEKMRYANDLLWFSIHAFINAAANISKCLWPDPTRKTDESFHTRGTELRKDLAVRGNSPLSSRKLRNHLEHMDERFEEWWLKSKKHNIARRTTGPIKGSIVGLAEDEKFEWFDPEQMIVVFQGDKFNLQEIMDEIVALKSRAEKLSLTH
jgi:hypothetical protein